MNYLPSASYSLAGLRQGGKTLEKRHRVVQRTGAVDEAACGITANPPCSVQRFYCIRRPGLRRIRISSNSLVSNTAASTTSIELSQRGAGAGLGIGLRRAGDAAAPNSGIFPLTGWPGPKERRR